MISRSLALSEQHSNDDLNYSLTRIGCQALRSHGYMHAAGCERTQAHRIDSSRQLEGIVVIHAQVPTTFEFVDVAGLVTGASKGEGLGNQFLGNIRTTDAIVQVCVLG